MNNKLKHIIYIIIGLAFVALCARIYRLVRALVNLNKILPQYLENQFGERPEMDLTLTLSFIVIKLTVSSEFFDKCSEIENLTRDYIIEFYPEINCDRMRIEVVTADSE